MKSMEGERGIQKFVIIFSILYLIILLFNSLHL
jgi:hypothetical protein